MTATSFYDPAVDAFRTEVRDWLAPRASSYRVTDDMPEAESLEIRRAFEQALYQAGLNCIAWPEKFGGRGYGPIEEFVFAEECIAAGAPEPLGRIGRLLAAPGLFVHGTAEQQKRFLPAILKCEEIWCQGFSEPNAGSDLASLRTTARRDGDRYLINGQKIWTTFGHYADRCLLLARTGERGGRHHGLTMFAVPMHQKGVQPRQIVQISGRADFNEVFYDDAEVPLDCVIGEENKGWQVAMTVLTAERGGGFAALAVKTMRDMVALLEQSVANRPELQPKFAAVSTEVEIACWQIRRTFELIGSGRDPLPSSSILKTVWSELMQKLVRFGFETDDPVHRDRWRFLELSARSNTIASGTSEIQRNIIAERVLGLPR